MVGGVEGTGVSWDVMGREVRIQGDGISGL